MALILIKAQIVPACDSLFASSGGFTPRKSAVSADAFPSQDYGPDRRCSDSNMATFVYRCPTTGLRVQGRVADDLSEGERKGQQFEGVTCSVCRRIHLVDPKTGKLLGEADK